MNGYMESNLIKKTTLPFCSRLKYYGSRSCCTEPCVSFQILHNVHCLKSWRGKLFNQSKDKFPNHNNWISNTWPPLTSDWQIWFPYLPWKLQLNNMPLHQVEQFMERSVTQIDRLPLQKWNPTVLSLRGFFSLYIVKARPNAKDGMRPCKQSCSIKNVKVRAWISTNVIEGINLCNVQLYYASLLIIYNL